MRVRAVLLLAGVAACCAAMATNHTEKLGEPVGKEEEEEVVVAPSTLGHVSRGHDKKEGGGLMSMVQKFAPMLAIPMSLQALAVPFQLGAVYLMLFYSVLIGKIAVTLMVANQIKQNAQNAELYKPLVHQHYGYDGSEEYGAWIS